MAVKTKCFILIFGLLVFYTNIPADQSQETAGLLEKLKVVKGKERVDVLNGLAYEFIYTDGETLYKKRNNSR